MTIGLLNDLCSQVTSWAVVSTVAWVVGVVGVGDICRRILYANKGQNALLIELGKTHLYDFCGKAITRGYRTVLDTTEVTAMYEAYSNLGGNHTGTDIYNQFMRLPLRKDAT